MSCFGVPSETFNVIDNFSCINVLKLEKWFQEIICVVCHDKSSGKHYGQFTCEGKIIHVFIWRYISRVLSNCVLGINDFFAKKACLL